MLEADRGFRKFASYRALPKPVAALRARDAGLERAHDAGRPYKLMLLDCQIPGMDGVEFARSLDASDSTIILMLTSDDLNSRLARMREAGRILIRSSRSNERNCSR